MKGCPMSRKNNEKARKIIAAVMAAVLITGLLSYGGGVKVHAAGPEDYTGIPVVNPLEEKTVPASEGTLAATYTDSGRSSIPKPSMDSLRKRLSEIPAVTTFYSVEPIVSGSNYRPAVLSEAGYANALAWINYYRTNAGLSEISFTDELNESASYGALCLAMIDELTHYPDKPADMSEEDYNKAYAATTSSNISFSSGWGTANVLLVAIRGQMADESAGNIPMLGHRRWLLHPNTKTMGIGSADNGGHYYTDVRVFGTGVSSETVSDYEFIAWPASGNNLSDAFARSVPWSITLNPSKYSSPDISKVQVKLTRESDGKTWTFSQNTGTSAGADYDYFNINNSGYGISNCIIFRPAYSGFTAYDGEYTVDVTGIYDRSGNEASLHYKVLFTDSKSTVGHDYEVTAWNWADDCSSATATFVCKNDKSHTATVSAIISVKESSAGCETPGRTVYTATATIDGKEYKDERISEGPALGHDWGEPEWTWTGNDTDGYTKASAKFICKRDSSHTQTVDAEITTETTPATCETDGEIAYIAAAVFEGENYINIKSVTIPASGHKWGKVNYTWTSDNSKVTAERICANDASHKESETANTSYTVTKAAGCEEAGTGVYTAVFTNPVFETQTKEVTINPTGHNFGAPVYTWASDNSSVSAERICANDESHKENETAETAYSVTRPATCEKTGIGVYTASFNNPAFSKQTKEVSIPAFGHDWEFTGWKWTGDDEHGYTAAKASFICRRDSGHTQDVEAVLTEKSEDGSCTEPGTVTYTAEVTFEGKTYSDSRTVTGVVMGHDWDDPEWTWTGNDTDGYTEASVKFICKRDTSHTETVAASVSNEVIPATCESDGQIIYTAAAVFEGEEYTDRKTIVIPAYGHDWNEPLWTWSEDYKSASAKFVCRNDEAHVETIQAEVISTVRDGRIVFTASAKFHGKTFTDSREFSAQIELDKTELVLKSDSEEKLTATYAGTEVEAKDVSWSSDNETAVTVDQNGNLTPKRAGFATITATANGFEARCEVKVLFDDVQNEKKFYYEPVYWALKNSITTGKAAYEFVPNGECTRGEFVTFLWRLYGSPDVSDESGFNDVPSGKWYSKAVTWAAENGITTGYKDSEGNPNGIFGLNDPCQRQEVVTFLWRTAGNPKAETDSGFKDVAKNKWYTEAINWAAENGITTGLKDSEGNLTGEFGGQRSCTRGENVTFLKRYADYSKVE